MARKSMTLLMNKDNTLPLKRGGLTIAVMGPNANDSVMQWGNYNGMPPHTVTILDGIRKALGSDDRLIYEQGCGWVERAQIQSVFNRCKTADGKPGFTARYWNNVTRDGEPVTTAQVTTPFHFVHPVPRFCSGCEPYRLLGYLQQRIHSRPVGRGGL